MPQYLVVAQHPPDLCPSANEKIRALASEGGKEMPALAEKLGVKILATYVPFTNHHVYVAVEADAYTGVPRGLGFVSIPGLARLMQDNRDNMMFSRLTGAGRDPAA